MIIPGPIHPASTASHCPYTSRPPPIFARLTPNGGTMTTSTLRSAEGQADGGFLGKDGIGGELRWQTIHSEPGRRIWYAEGFGRAVPLLPALSLRAVVLLRYQEVRGDDGRFGIRHRVEVFAL